MVVRTKSKRVQQRAEIEGGLEASTSMTTGNDGSEGESRRM